MSPARPQTSRRSEGPPTASRRLDFSTTQGRQSPYYSASKSPRGRPTSASKRTQRDVYDYPQSPELNDEDLPNGISDHDDDLPNGIEDEDLPPTLNDDDDEVEEEEGEESVHQLRREEEAAATKAQAASPSNNKRKRGRRSNAEIAAEAQRAHEQTPDVEEEVPDTEVVEPPTKKRGGRPPKSQARAALATKDKNQAAKKGPRAKRDPAPRATSKEPSHMNALQRQRHQTPLDEDGFTHTRSGRTSYKPLVFWKGERAVFEPNFETAQNLPSLQEIIRIEEVTPQKRSIHRSNRSKKTTRKARASVFGEDDPEDFDGFEPWETGEGTQEAPVAQWDAEQGVTSQEEEQNEIIAFSANRIQPRPSPDNPSFHFTKCLTTEFFGSGMIELPPEGNKGRKNSRKFQFTFYVCSGKVAVEVAGTRFVISKGGMWQVPRGMPSENTAGSHVTNTTQGTFTRLQTKADRTLHASSSRRLASTNQSSQSRTASIDWPNERLLRFGR